MLQKRWLCQVKCPWTMGDHLLRKLLVAEFSVVILVQHLDQLLDLYQPVAPKGVSRERNTRTVGWMGGGERSWNAKGGAHLRI